MRVVHSIPGRVRLGLDPESPAPNLDDVLQIGGVEEATFNNITKSLLIVYDDKMLLEGLLSGLEEKTPQVREFSESVSAATNAATNEDASATSLFALSLVALVGFVILIGIDPPTVPAYALVWWGFNISRGWLAPRG